MSLSFGFYDSLNHDRTYTASQMSEIFNGIINDGIFQSIGEYLTVSQNTGMTVNIGTGRAWFNGTWSLNDAEYPITLDAAPYVAGFSRIDAVCLAVNKDLSARENYFTIVKGQEVSVTPSRPVMPNTDTLFYHPLAYIRVDYGVTAITQSMITNVVGTSVTPFVTGILQTASIDSLLTQWQAQWNEWLINKTGTAEEQWDEFVETYSDNWESWFETATESEEILFQNWFENIKGQLSEDAAGRLQNEIDKLKNIYVQDYILYLPNTAASVTSDGILVLGTD